MTTTTLQPVSRDSTPSRFTPSDWVIPIILVIFSLVPVVAGGLRLSELITGVEIIGDGARFQADPWPVVIHIISASTYAMLGAFQFSKGIRKAWHIWHRVAGKVLIVAGVLAAASGIWMVQFYPHNPEGSELLAPARLIFASATIVCLYLGLKRILRHDVTSHRAWMIRAYAIFVAAGTQVFVTVPYLLVFGEPDRVTGDWLLISGWMINIVGAEWIIRTRPFVNQRRAAKPARA